MRAFTKREKALLVILTTLILGVAYYFAFFQPIQEQITAAQVRMEVAANDLTIEQARGVKYAQMKAEIAAIEAAGTEIASVIPDYNNLRSVMLQLHGIMSMATTYDISFPNIVEGERTITRPVRINITAVNYERAKQIIQALADCRFRCTVDGVDMTDADPNAMTANLRTNAVEATILVSFYERNTLPKPAPEAPAGAG